MYQPMHNRITLNTAPEVLAAAMGDEGLLDITKASSAQVFLYNTNTCIVEGKCMNICMISIIII